MLKPNQTIFIGLDFFPLKTEPNRPVTPLAGGIWLLWNDDRISIRKISEDEQFLHVEIEAQNERSWNLTVLYASPRRRDDLRLVGSG